MKKELLLTIFVAGIAFPALFAQGEWTWAKAYSGKNDPMNPSTMWNEISNSAFDDEGNVYIYGQFSLRSDIDGEPVLDLMHEGAGYWLAKFDINGNMVWKKVICSSRISCEPGWMELHDNKITISGAYQFYEYDPLDYLYWLDTVIWTYRILQMPESERKLPFAFVRGSVSFFVTLDLDGNLIDQHFVAQKWRPEADGTTYFPSSLTRTKDPFHIDRQGNIYLYCEYSYWGDENDPFTIVVDDTLEYPFYISGGGNLDSNQMENNVLLYKFSPDWELLQVKKLIDHTVGLGSSREYWGDGVHPPLEIWITGLSADEEDNMYLSGTIRPINAIFYHSEINSYPAYIYWDTTHAAKIYDSLTFYFPFIIKFDTDHNIVWSNQIYIRQASQDPFAVHAVFGGNTCRNGKVIVIGRAADLNNSNEPEYIFFDDNINLQLNRICFNRAFYAAFDAHTGSYFSHGVVNNPRRSSIDFTQTIPAYLNNQIFALTSAEPGGNDYNLMRWGDDGTVLESVVIPDNGTVYRSTGPTIVNEQGYLFTTGFRKEGDSPLVLDNNHVFYPSSTGSSLTFFAMRYDSAYTVPYVGIKEQPLSAENHIRLYPNPASTFVTIETPNNPFQRAELYDMTGQLLGSYTTQIIPVAHFTSGIYLLKIYTAHNREQIVKLNIIH